MSVGNEVNERSGYTVLKMSHLSFSAWLSVNTIRYYSRRAIRYKNIPSRASRTETNFVQNRMMESLVLFDSVLNSRWFVRTSIILFLNKVDLFREKLPRSPLSNYFPDYSGGNDVNRAAKYLLWRFNQVNRQHLNLYPQ